MQENPVAEKVFKGRERPLESVPFLRIRPRETVTASATEANGSGGGGGGGGATEGDSEM